MLHELSHAARDSVAPHARSDVWLNEGHATWYELLCADEHGWVADDTGVDDGDGPRVVHAVRLRDPGPAARGNGPRRPAALGRRERRVNINVYFGGAPS